MGNLLYYRYVNPAIIAPEAFDVLEVAKSDEVQYNGETFSFICKQFNV